MFWNHSGRVLITLKLSLTEKPAFKPQLVIKVTDAALYTFYVMLGLGCGMPDQPSIKGVFSVNHMYVQSDTTSLFKITS